MTWDQAFSVVVVVDDGHASVVANGDVDAFTFPRLRAAILHEVSSEDVSTVAVDVSAVDFIDQRSMSELIQMTESAKRSGKTLIVRKPAHRFMRLRGIIDTGQVLQIECV